MFFYDGVSIPDTLTLVASLFVFSWLILSKPRMLIISILLINMILSLLSFYFIEMGGYITELGRFSYRTNNLFIYSVYILFFLFTFVFFASQFSKNLFVRPNNQSPTIKINSNINHLVGVILLFVIVAEYISFVFYGIPIMQGQNKVDVAMANTVVKYIGSTGTYLSVFFGMMFAATRKNKFLILFLCHFLFCVLAAQKFSALLNNMVFFIAPQLVAINKLRITKRLLIFSFVFVSFICYVFFMAYDIENAFSRELGLSTWLAMGYRALYLSAHAQWAVLESLYLSNGLINLSLDQFLDFHKFIVEQLHPEDTSESLNKGVTFGMIYPSYLLYSMPIYFHPFLLALFSGVLAFVFELFVWSVRNGRIILACLVCVMLNILVRVIITGNFSLLFGSTMVLASLLLVVYIALLLNTSKPNYKGNYGNEA